MRECLPRSTIAALLTNTNREEQDEETMEWEQEQLRRGGLRVSESTQNAPKPVYKPAPSMSLLAKHRIF